MPQIFQVLRCFKCMIFQVHHTKKSNKWECKLCGVKQSIKRHHGVGTAKECRVHVQKLNELQYNSSESKLMTDCDLDHVMEQEHFDTNKTENASQDSKWSKYLENDMQSHNSSNSADMELNGKMVVFELPQKKRKITNNKTKTKISMKTASSENNQPENIQSSNIDKIIKIDKCSGKCVKTPLLESHSDKISNFNLISQNTLTLSIPQQTYKKIILQLNSKWSQYIDESDNVVSNHSNVSKVDDVIYKHFKAIDIFSLSDENDLDNVLDI